MDISVLALLGQKRYTTPMGIRERLASVIKSYINDHDSSASNRYTGNSRNDPDLDAAYEELDDFLTGKDSKKNADGETRGREEKARTVPKELWEDFAELGLATDASFEECREAYKKLLKIHHPDRHVKHAENMKKATEKSARVNASYDRIEKWFKMRNDC